MVFGRGLLIDNNIPKVQTLKLADFSIALRHLWVFERSGDGANSSGFPAQAKSIVASWPETATVASQLCVETPAEQSLNPPANARFGYDSSGRRERTIAKSGPQD